MSLEDKYRKAKRVIKKRDAKLAKQGTTAGQETSKTNRAKKDAANVSGRAAAFHGATDQVSNRGTKWTKPTSEAQDAAAGKPKPKKPPQQDTLF